MAENRTIIPLSRPNAGNTQQDGNNTTRYYTYCRKMPGKRMRVALTLTSARCASEILPQSSGQSLPP